MAISLASLQSGGDIKPPRILLYGVEGVGKTTFGAAAPSPVFIQTEDGLSEIDCPAFPKASTYGEVMEALTSLATEEHKFKTLVIDSVDWLEPLVQKHACEQNNWQSIEDPGYGKGYVATLDYWRDYINALNYLRDERGMAIIQLAHNDIKVFQNPETEPYDRYIVKLHKSASSLIREHCDCVFFANYRIGTTQSGEGFNKTTRAIGSGERVLYTQERPAFMAKSRYTMPDTLPLDWSAVAQHIRFYAEKKEAA